MKNYLILVRIKTININPEKINIKAPIAAGIQNGARIHHHDQLITLQSLRITNVIPKAVERLIPLDS